MQFASRHKVMQGGSYDAFGSHPCQVPGLDYADGARLLPTTNPEDPKSEKAIGVGQSGSAAIGGNRGQEAVKKSPEGAI